jgi:hypothetical protein
MTDHIDLIGQTTAALEKLDEAYKKLTEREPIGHNYYVALIGLRDAVEQFLKQWHATNDCGYHAAAQETDQARPT